MTEPDWLEMEANGRLIDRQHMELLGRPDRALPPELRHDAIAEAAMCNTAERFAYRITFADETLPLGYRERLADSEWEIADAAVDHAPRDGLLGLLGATTARLSIFVADTVTDRAGGDT